MEIIVLILILYYVILWVLLLKIVTKAAARASLSDIGKIEKNTPSVKWREVPPLNKHEKIKLFIILINMLLIFIGFGIIIGSARALVTGWDQ
jgi:hypothetical protein